MAVWMVVKMVVLKVGGKADGMAGMMVVMTVDVKVGYWADVRVVV